MPTTRDNCWCKDCDIEHIIRSSSNSKTHDPLDEVNQEHWSCDFCGDVSVPHKCKWCRITEERAGKPIFLMVEEVVGMAFGRSAKIQTYKWMTE